MKSLIIAFTIVSSVFAQAQQGSLAASKASMDNVANAGGLVVTGFVTVIDGISADSAASGAKAKQELDQARENLEYVLNNAKQVVVTNVEWARNEADAAKNRVIVTYHATLDRSKEIARNAGTAVSNVTSSALTSARNTKDHVVFKLAVAEAELEAQLKRAGQSIDAFVTYGVNTVVNVSKNVADQTGRVVLTAIGGAGTALGLVLTIAGAPVVILGTVLTREGQALMGSSRR